jgi:hypothetical protein
MGDTRLRDRLLHAGGDEKDIGPNCLQLLQFGGCNRAAAHQEYAAAGKRHEER